MKENIMSIKACKKKQNQYIKNIIGIWWLTYLFLACSHKTEKEIINELPNPLANFSSTLVSENDPFTYKFSNQSENYKNVTWDFGDDSVSYDEMPVHTFLIPGEFKVKMVVKNEVNDWAQKELVVKIDADSILDIHAEKYTENIMKLSAKTSMDIDSIYWYRDSSSNLILINKSASIDVSAPSGSLENYTLKVKTKNNSIVQISRLLSERGIVYDVTNAGIFSVSTENNSGKDANEGSLKLIDNLKTTKYLSSNYAGKLWFELKYYTPIVISAYTFITGNDAPSRDPKDWYIAGSDDGNTWNILDQHTGESFTDRRMSVTYLFNNKTPYNYYRIYITAIKSGTLFQMSEMRMLQFPTE